MTSLQLKAFKIPPLQPINLTIAAGECLTLSGPSGCGKSQLLRAIADLDPHEGQAYYQGQEQREMSGPQWRSQVGLLPAESHWWAAQVGDHFREDPDEFLVALGLTAAWLTREVRRLSSGERQRLALARLLSARPGVLLLDEPSANLDPENAQRVEQLILSCCQQQQIAALWVTHDPAQQQRVGQRHFQIHQGVLEASSACS